MHAFLPFKLISLSYTGSYHFSSYLAHFPNIVGFFKYSSNFRCKKSPSHRIKKNGCAQRHWWCCAHFLNIVGALRYNSRFSMRKMPPHITWKWVKKHTRLWWCYARFFCHLNLSHHHIGAANTIFHHSLHIYQIYMYLGLDHKLFLRFDTFILLLWLYFKKIWHT